MIFLPKLFILTSFFSIFCFLIDESGISQSIPVVSPFGRFLHEYWFADYKYRSMAHRGKFSRANPPLVAVAGQGGPLPWPYASGAGGSGVTFTDNYQDVLKTTESYTPVNGLYGVTNERETDEPLKQYYPDALEPNDYIAARLLGEQSQGYNDLTYLANNQVYNTKAFAAGTPFKTAQIGPNNANDPRWTSLPTYASLVPNHGLMVPLTTTNYGGYVLDPQTETLTNVRDYSGSETQNDPNFANTLEAHTVSQYGARPSWYGQDQNANVIPYEGRSTSVYPGDLPWMTTPTYINSVQVYPEFTTPKSANVGGSPGQQNLGWGSPAAANPYVAPMQLTYIQRQLAQEDPINIV